MNFDALQEIVDQWIQGHGRYRSKFEILARLTEDPGEIATTLQHTEDLRTGRDELNMADIGKSLIDHLFMPEVPGGFCKPRYYTQVR